ncbi:salt stress protein, Slr1339 family [Chroococcidiopsis sp.]|uniref:salt stress protein, Slr1339 family n=1 Tax=Chroococcidiopsis sp. TaxID=3088168 RepID=UPI003F305465
MGNGIDDLLYNLGEPMPKRSGTDDLISSMKAEQIQHDLKRQKDQQAAVESESKRQLEEMKTAAEQWLKTLDRKSTEGLWFEEFACNYSTEIEAAIDYLKAVQA